MKYFYLIIFIFIFLLSCSKSKENNFNEEQLYIKNILTKKHDSLSIVSPVSISSYSAPKSKISISTPQKDYTLNLSIKIISDSLVKFSVFAPIIPVTLANITISRDSLLVRSSLMDFNLNESVPPLFVHSIQSVFYGTIDNKLFHYLETDSILLKTDFFHLYSSFNNIQSEFVLDSSLHINKVLLSSNDLCLCLSSDDYSFVDKVMLPHNINFNFSTQSQSSNATLKLSSIKLNIR